MGRLGEIGSSHANDRPEIFTAPSKADRGYKILDCKNCICNETKSGRRERKKEREEEREKRGKDDKERDKGSLCFRYVRAK